MYRRIFHRFLPFGLAAIVAGCSGPSGGNASEVTNLQRSLTIRGSDTMVILAQRWAVAFMEAHPDTLIQVSGGGSGTGIASLINGTSDLANASRPMKERERKRLAERRGAEVHEVRVALDALAIYVPISNPIRTLTISQLKQIFRGQIRNWKELGGPDRPIVLYSRENNSGTYAHFKEHVLDREDFAPHAQTLPGTAAVINAVVRDANGIGYGGIAYAQGVRTISIASEDGTPIEPTLENATQGRYPLARYLLIYSAGELEGMAKQYVDFALSDSGQAIVEGIGYYPLPEESVALPGTGS